MAKDMEVIISESVQLGAVQVTSPEEIVARASSVATVLANVINEKKLYTVIGKKKYVQVDGWATLGAMIGILPRETKSEKIDNGYLAFVELVRTTDGMIIGGASAICTREERNWSKRDEYALKSMATTRATGKAFRLGFSWIMNLAGYESTPAEEMIVEAKFIEQPTKANKTAKNKDSKREKLITPMSLEMAENETSGKDGKRYGDTELEELNKKLIGITKWLNNDDNKAVPERESYLRKKDAIITIRAYKQQG